MVKLFVGAAIVGTALGVGVAATDTFGIFGNNPTQAAALSWCAAQPYGDYGNRWTPAGRHTYYLRYADHMVAGVLGTL